MTICSTTRFGILGCVIWASGLMSPLVFGASNPSAPSTHWSLQPPRAPDLPSVNDPDWIRTPVDAFILNVLEREGMTPSPAADRRTMIRRATYDLLGLPPSPEEVEAFVSDERPDAYARLVDRLLASPGYGERWGRYWLDVARFADTKGYTYGGEAQRWMHAPVYRDWVIRSFNDDMPYDRFLILQLAADQLASTPHDESLAAMGFLTIGRRFLGVEADIIDDRIDVMTRGMLGLTVACARCHDHKFDPISTKDYYALYGVFQASYEQRVRLGPHDDSSPEPTAFDVELKKRLDKWNTEFTTRRDLLEDATRRLTPEYWVAALDVGKSLPADFDQILGVDDINHAITRRWYDYILSRTRNLDDPIFAPWRLIAGLSDAAFAEGDGVRVLAMPELNGSSATINSKVREIFKDPVASREEAATRYGTLLADVHEQWKKKTATALATETDGGSSIPSGFEDADLEALRWVLYSPGSPAVIPPGAFPTIEDFFDGPSRGALRGVEGSVDNWIAGAADGPAYAVVLKDLPVAPQARVFVRGDPTKRGEEVPRRYLTVLSHGDPEPFPHGSGRLDLARAIASPDNPLTARVMVNRIWLHHFGRGLVATPSDFGVQGEAPSHPELLDDLAMRFMNAGWSVKAMHRLMMLSNTYRQSSAPVSVGDALERDPANRLLWKMNRRRLDFEGMWDGLLVVTGKLEPRMRGKSEALLAGTGSRRRAVYGTVDRRYLPSVYRTFDVANPDAHTPRRHATTVPQQALFFLNSPVIADRARALAQRREVNGDSDLTATIQSLYLQVFQREPNETERAAATAFLTQRIEPPVEPVDPASTAWQYGYGKRDADTGKVLSFVPLPHFTGDAWQGGDAWPDSALGWVQLTAHGGHAGNDLDHAAIRRWVSPFSGHVNIAGTVRHDHEPGDGIRAAIVSSRHGELGSWELHHDAAVAGVADVEVAPGDIIDFVVDYRDGLNSDMFLWAPVLSRHTPADGPLKEGETDAVWSAEKHFIGPPPGPRRPLTVLEQYAQVLLLSNEFMFVD